MGFFSSISDTIQSHYNIKTGKNQSVHINDTLLQLFMEASYTEEAAKASNEGHQEMKMKRTCILRYFYEGYEGFGKFIDVWSSI